MACWGICVIKSPRLLYSYALSAAILVSLTPVCHSHGRLLDPPSRATMWRLGFDSPADYDDHQGYCGGKDALWRQFGGRCGVCGDPYYPIPRAHERGGWFYRGTPTRKYKSGSLITVTVGITANHRGWLEFRLCAYDDPEDGDLEYDSEGTFVEVTQRCLNRHVLKMENGNTRFYLPEPYSAGEYKVRVRLPRGLACRKCLFQWKWNVGNSWGTNPDGESCTGCGEQEQFYACADVVIRRRDETGDSPPRSRPTTHRPHTPNRKSQNGRKNKGRHNKNRAKNTTMENDRTENVTTFVPQTTHLTTSKTFYDKPFWWVIQHIPLFPYNTEKGKTLKDSTIENLHPRYTVMPISTSQITIEGIADHQKGSASWVTIPIISDRVGTHKDGSASWTTIPIISDKVGTHKDGSANSMTTPTAAVTGSNQHIAPSFWKWVSSMSPRFRKSFASAKGEHIGTILPYEAKPETIYILNTSPPDRSSTVNSASASSHQELPRETDIFRSWWRKLSAKLNIVLLQGLFGDTEVNSRSDKDDYVGKSLKSDTHEIQQKRSRRAGEAFNRNTQNAVSTPMVAFLGQNVGTNNTSVAADPDTVDNDKHSFRSLYDKENRRFNESLVSNPDVDNKSNKEHKFQATLYNRTETLVDDAFDHMLHNDNSPEHLAGGVSVLNTHDSAQMNKLTHAQEQAKISADNTQRPALLQTFTKALNKRSIVAISQEIVDPKLVMDDLRALIGTIPSSSAATPNLAQENQSHPVDGATIQHNSLNAPDTEGISQPAKFITETNTSPFGEVKEESKPGICTDKPVTDTLNAESTISALSSTPTSDVVTEEKLHLMLTLATSLEGSHMNFSINDKGVKDSDVLSADTFLNPDNTRSLLTSILDVKDNTTDGQLNHHHTNGRVNKFAQVNQANTAIVHSRNFQTDRGPGISIKLEINDTRETDNTTGLSDNIINGTLRESHIPQADLAISANHITETIQKKAANTVRFVKFQHADNSNDKDNNIGLDKHDKSITRSPTVSENNGTSPITRSSPISASASANIGMHDPASEASSEVYSENPDSHLPRGLLYEKRMLLHDRLDRLSATLNSGKSTLSVIRPSGSKQKDCFTGKQADIDRLHDNSNLQLVSSDHNRQGWTVGKIENHDGSFVSRKGVRGHRGSHPGGVSTGSEGVTGTGLLGGSGGNSVNAESDWGQEKTHDELTQKEEEEEEASENKEEKHAGIEGNEGGIYKHEKHFRKEDDSRNEHDEGDVHGECEHGES